MFMELEGNETISDADMSYRAMQIKKVKSRNQKKQRRAEKHFKLANLYDDKLIYEKAHKHYLRAIKLNPRLKKAHINFRLSQEKKRCDNLLEEKRKEKEKCKTKIREFKKAIESLEEEIGYIFEDEECLFKKWEEIKNNKINNK